MGISIESKPREGRHVYSNAKSSVPKSQRGDMCVKIPLPCKTG